MKGIFSERSRTVKTSVIFIVFWSIVIGFVNVGILYLFGIPIFGLLSGIILLWIGKSNLKEKILWTFAPIPLIIAGFFLLYLLSSKAEPETFLISQDFRGEFEVVFNEPCGQALPYEKGRRIYRIPANGVLITNAKQTFGVIDREFYLFDEDTNHTRLTEFHWSKFEEEQNEWHWKFSKIELSKELVGVFWAYRNGLSFIISNYRSLEAEDRKAREQRREKFSDTVKSSLQECRKIH